MNVVGSMRRPFPLLLWLAALAAVAVQAMALATRYYQPWLDGDYLLPERFAADVVAGVYPLSGWTFSSSPYFFPDLTLSVVGRALLGDAPLLPFYVITSYVTLALLSGWSLRRVLGADGQGWLLGALLINALLAFQGVADHARWLWWLGTATFHGGAVLLGLAQFALWTGAPETAPSRGRTVAATVLLFLGLVSDTLLLTQFVLPLGVALFATAGAPRWSSPRLRTFLKAVAVAYVLVVLVRGAMHLAHWGNFPSVVRYAPTPTAIAGSADRMLGDLSGFVASSIPAFIVLFIVGIAGVVWLSFRRLKSLPTPSEEKPLRPLVIHYMTNGLTVEQRQAGWFAGTGLASTLLLPALAVYWQNPQNGRYLLPCLVLPLWWLGTLLPTAKLRGPLAGGTAALALLGLIAWRAPQVRLWDLGRPYPPEVNNLDGFLGAPFRGSMRHGLGDFWNSNYLNFVSKKVRLNQLRPDGRTQFWGNNAFQHFSSETPNGPLRPHRYDFIIMNGLDAVAVRAKFGEPTRMLEESGYTLWLYDEAGAQRISALVDAEVRAFVDGRPGSERIAKP